MIRRLRWVAAIATAATALAWAAQALLERLRPTHVTDPERPELRLRANLTAAEHRAIVAAQDAAILAAMYGTDTAAGA